MTSCFVYKVIKELESIDHLSINPIRRTSDLSIRVSSSEVYTLVINLAIVNKVLRHCPYCLARQLCLSFGKVHMESHSTLV